MARRTLLLRDESGAEHEVEIANPRAAVVAGREVSVVFTRPGELRAGGRTLWAASDGDLRWVFVEGRVYVFDLKRQGTSARLRARPSAGLSAPMPSTVIKIPVAAGQQVRAGDVLIVLEAMKMELPVRAPSDGVVSTVHCRVGELVQPGQDLIEIAPIPESPTPNGPSTPAAEHV